MPLLAADLDRYLRLQRPTFERFYGDLGTTWVVTPRADVSAVAAAIARIDGVRVLDERELVPELVLERWGRGRATGWHVQQLVKLAAAAHVRAPFVLAVDADVVAVRSVTDRDLVVDGRALRPAEPASDHPEWVAQAAAVLGVEPLDYLASVTPSVLAPEAVRLLATYVEQHVTARRRRLRAAALAPGLRRLARSWRGRLLGALPWTEYQLYDTFLVRSRAFERFHRYSADPILYGNSVWDLATFAEWRATPATTGPVHFFSVVQGNTGVVVDAVAAKLAEAGFLG
jgi:hypothetical protein